MPIYRLHIDSSTPEQAALKWVWSTFCYFAKLEFTLTDESENADFTIGENINCTVRYNPVFWDKINRGIYAGKDHLTAEGYVLFNDGSIDYFTTAFYFINCIWEYDITRRDSLGRSDYTQSVWAEMGLDCTENRVANIFKFICEKNAISYIDKPSVVFLSHDIDSLYGAWKEDGKTALKRGNIIEFMGGLGKHIIGSPAWFNIQDIVDFEKSHQAKSTFFWLTEKGRVNKRCVNSDYSIFSQKVINSIHYVHNNGLENGLHKSLQKIGFREELAKLPIATKYNRHHYLKFSIPEIYNEWEKAGLEIDCSLGYAEHFGFRNGYGEPYYPFDLVQRKAVCVLQVPLHIMDGTFSKYKKIEAEKAFELILEFIEKNNVNSVISILWHNSHFTDFKYMGYPKLYGDIIHWLNSNGFRYTSLGEIGEEYMNSKNCFK